MQERGSGPAAASLVVWRPATSSFRVCLQYRATDGTVSTIRIAVLSHRRELSRQRRWSRTVCWPQRGRFRRDSDAI